MRSPWHHTITRGYTVEVIAPSAVPWDALSAPSNDDLVTAAQTLWPTGAAWGTPDGEAMSPGSMLGRLTRVLVDDFARLYARAYRLTLEASPSGAADLLDDWEQDYGLPDGCFPGDQTTTQRLAALARKVRGTAVSHPEDFIRVAAELGFEIEIEEPAIFECGFSECGGRHETGDVREECYWIVRVRDAAVSYFECGVSECGHDPLFDLGVAEQILCLLRSLAPAWTLPVLQPWINYGVLGDGAGNAISDGYGNPILILLDS